MHLRSATRPLHQSVSDYTLRQWFSNTQQSRFRTAWRCLEKLVIYTLHFWHVILLHHRRRRIVRVNRCAVPWSLAISDLHIVDSCSRALASSWTLFPRYIHRQTQSIMCWYVGRWRHKIRKFASEIFQNAKNRPQSCAKYFVWLLLR